MKMNKGLLIASLATSLVLAASVYGIRITRKTNRFDEVDYEDTYPMYPQWSNIDKSVKIKGK